MTGKRFRLREPNIDYDIYCEEITDKYNWITYGEIVDLLNDFYDENKELKMITNLFSDRELKRLKKENEMLKREKEELMKKKIMEYD